MGLYIHSDTRYQNNRLHNFYHSEYIDFFGTLYLSPSRGRDTDILYLKVDKIYFNNQEKKMSGNLRISVPHSAGVSETSNLLINDRLKISARLLPWGGMQNFSSPSYQTYFKIQNIHNRAYSKTPWLIEKLASGKAYHPLRIISQIRRKIQNNIERHFTLPNDGMLSSPGAIMEALLLGARERMDDNTSRSFQKAGLYHILAISGAHIAIMSFFLFFFFKVIKIPLRTSYIMIIFFLIFYAFLVEGRPSVIRATIMALAFLLGKLFWKDVNLINALSISAFFLLLFNPASLFSLGFQLTFTATLAIILFFPRIIKRLPRIPGKISEIFTVSLSAQLGVLPFTVSAFYRITFSSLLLNLAAIPMVALIMAGGYFFLCLSLFSFPLAHIIAKALSFCIHILLLSTQISDFLPWLSYRLPPPPLLISLGYFTTLFLILLPKKTKRQKLAAAMAFLVFLAILISHPFPSNSKTLKISFIDVGQGDSILIEFPGCQKMLVDGGGSGSGSFDIGERIVSPFLWHKGIKKIDYLVLTHPHPDHMLGLQAVARNFRIAEFWEAHSPEGEATYNQFKKALSSRLVYKKIFKGNTRDIGGVSLQVLHPPKNPLTAFTGHNNQSLAIQLTYGKTSFLLTGDIEALAEQEILSSSPNIRSQVLKSPHHGSHTSSSIDFLKAVSPEITVISVGRSNPYHLPSTQILERYTQLGIKVYRTDIHGAVEITSDGHTLSIRTARPSTEQIQKIK